MRLPFSKIKEITVGAVEIRECAEEIRFFKCTDLQTEAWERLAPFLGANARSTTGIRLDFYTDSAFVKVATTGGKRYEVKIDGLFADNFLDEKGEGTEFELRFQGEKKKRRVTLIFPHHSVGGLRYVEVDDDAEIFAVPFEKKFLFLGDSITQGFCSGKDCCSFAALTGDFFNAESVIQGVGGGFFDENTLQPINYLPDTVFVAYGTNDFTRYKKLVEVRERSRAYFRKLKTLYPEAKIFVISPLWRPDGNEKREIGSLEDCALTIRKEAEKADFIFIDGFSLVPHDKSFFHDNVHPNGSGFFLYAYNLIKKIYKQIVQ